MGLVFEEVVEALVENLRNALQVAGDGAGSAPERLSKAELARRTGLSRDTVGKLIPEHTSTEAEENGVNARPGNCDLKTLCVIAQHLGISPAFLLMTQEDWHLLVSAISGLADWEQNASAKAEFNARLKAVTGIRKVEVGLTMAHAQGFRPAQIPEDSGINGMALYELQQKVDRTNAARRRSILTTIAVAQPAARFREELFTVTALAAQVGATTKIATKGNDK